MNEQGSGRLGLTNLHIPQTRLADFCRHHHIRKLAFFGSVLRHDFGPESDVDVLVEFDPAFVPGLAFFAMKREFSEMLERKVDLNTQAFLSERYRDRVLEEAEVYFASQ